MSTQNATPVTPALPVMPHELALNYFTAILTKDTLSLRTQFGWTVEQTAEITADLQTTAATKLISAGNIITRKMKAPDAPPAVKATANVTPAPAVVGRFQTTARLKPADSLMHKVS